MKVFGPFRFDPDNQRINRGSASTRLTAKASAVLEVLVERANDIVTHDELLDSVWHGVNVQPEVLKVYIAEIRRALRDSADKPRYVETIHRQGYRLKRTDAGLRPPDRLPKAKTLVSRVQEIETLWNLLRKAERGRYQTVFITGKEGIGKTTLLNTFLSRAARRPGINAAVGRVAHARGEHEPFCPILNAIDHLLRGPHREAITSALHESAPGWLLQFPSLIEPGQTDRLRRQLTGATSQRMIREFAELLLRRGNPFILLGIDDLHRADPSTLDLLEYIASSTPAANLMVIATADDVEAPDRVRSLIASLRARRLCEELKLDLFSTDHVRRFLSHRYAHAGIAEALAKRLHTLTGGLPLFVVSVVDYMEAQGWILKSEGRWLLSDRALRLEELVPPVLTDFIEVKIRQLPAEEQCALEAGSIVGMEFTSWIVGEVLGTFVAAPDDVCNSILGRGGWLQSAGFVPVFEDEISPGYRFLHPIFREVFYNRQSPSERVARHRGVAAALERTVTQSTPARNWELATHFLAARECSRSIDYLRAAAATSSRRYAGSEAAALLTEARRLAKYLSPSTRSRIELKILDELGGAFFACDNFEACAQVWHEAVRKAIKHKQIETAIRIISRLAFPLGWETPALLASTSERLIGHVGEIMDPVLRSEAMLRVLALRDIGGEWTSADSKSAADALSIIVRDGDGVQKASALARYAWFELRTSAYDSALARLEESLPVVMEHEPSGVIRAEWALGWALLHSGRWGRMQSVATAAALHARKNGSRRIEALFTLQLAWLHVECGAWVSARDHCVQALQLAHNPDAGLTFVIGQVIMARAAIGAQDPEGGLECIGRALSAKPTTGSVWLALAEISTVEAQLLRRDLSEIRRGMRRLARSAETWRDQTWKAVALSVCARASADTGQHALSHSHSGAALDLVRRFRLPLAAWRAEAAAAHVISASDPESARNSRVEQLRDKSRMSLQHLIDSLATEDPLRVRASKLLQAT